MRAMRPVFVGTSQRLPLDHNPTTKRGLHSWLPLWVVQSPLGCAKMAELPILYWRAEGR